MERRKFLAGTACVGTAVAFPFQSQAFIGLVLRMILGRAIVGGVGRAVVGRAIAGRIAGSAIARGSVARATTRAGRVGRGQARKAGAASSASIPAGMVDLADLGMTIGDIIGVSQAHAATIENDEEIAALWIKDKENDFVLEGQNAHDYTVAGSLIFELYDEETGEIARGHGGNFILPAGASFRKDPIVIKNIASTGIKYVTAYAPGHPFVAVREKVFVVRSDEVFFG